MEDRRQENWNNTFLKEPGFEKELTEVARTNKNAFHVHQRHTWLITDVMG